MPRIRSVKPDFFKSEDVSVLPLRARLTWIGLWTQCDDHGRYKDSARLIKGDLWSLDDVSLRDIEEDLHHLEKERRLVRYEVDGKRYLAVVNWHAHQAINRPGRAKHPAPPKPLGSADADADTYCSTGECTAGNKHARLSEDSVRTHGASPEQLSAELPVDNSNGAAQRPKSSDGSGFTEPSVSAHGALTPGREGKGRERKGGDARASPTPPPPQCPKHADDPDPPNCGACADARKRRERWDVDRAAEAAAARSAEAHDRAIATRAAIDACGQCDNEGRLAAGALCHHDPSNTERARQRAAESRAQLGRRPPVRDTRPPDDPIAQAHARRRQAEAEHQAEEAT